MKKYLKLSTESIEVIDKCLVRAAELVRSFKQVAVDQSTDNIRPVKLDLYLKEILTTLSPRLKKTHHSIHTECCDSEVNINAGALYQIITNLVINSLIHGFHGIENGNIFINISVKEGQIILDYVDDGVGMDDKGLNSLFEPFYTTKRGSGGTGLGAHIIYNLVTQALKGEVEANSEPNKGLQYKITFPITDKTMEA
jgi:signal transduction histidine kinase